MTLRLRMSGGCCRWGEDGWTEGHVEGRERHGVAGVGETVVGNETGSGHESNFIVCLFLSNFIVCL